MPVLLDASPGRAQNPSSSRGGAWQTARRPAREGLMRQALDGRQMETQLLLDQFRLPRERVTSMSQGGSRRLEIQKAGVPSNPSRRSG